MNIRIRSLAAALATLATLAMSAAAFAQAAAGVGEVRKIDATQQKITLKHNGLAPFDMPPMAMAFRVKDPAVLTRFVVGDHVSFSVEKLDGTYTVTQIQKAAP